MYKAITITHGSGGWGGPLTVCADEKKNKVLSVIGGGIHPVAQKIAEMAGCEAVDVAAYTLGASVIERHYTLDRTWKGTDHAASLEPDGIRKLVGNLNAVYESLTCKSQEILPIEQVQRDKLKYRK